MKIVNFSKYDNMNYCSIKKKGKSHQQMGYLLFPIYEISGVIRKLFMSDLLLKFE